MKLLLKGTHIITFGDDIQFGVFDEPFEKWQIQRGEFIEYYIDNGYTVVDNVTIPEDYVGDKYFFADGEFVLNPDWKPYVSTEERIAELEELIKAQREEITMLNDTLLEVLMG
ncbi:MAG: hypothetical protein IKB07_08140 [Lachnospiraceae bacterium]|nr:hypothetical protein [Lachnospiraceae bacterium]